MKNNEMMNRATKPIRVGMMSSLAEKTGAALRGEYIFHALQEYADVYYFRPNKKRGILNYFLFIPKDIARSFYKKFDFFIVLKPFPGACIPALINRFFTKSKLIFDIDDLDHTYRKGFTARIIESMQKYFVRKADYVAVQKNEDLIRYIANSWKIDPEKIITIEQGVDAELFKPFHNPASQIKPERKEKIICFTGHLGQTAVAELTSLLRIYKKLNREDVKLIIAGGGSKLEYFKAFAKNLNLKIIFTGYLRNTEFPAILDSADICLCYYIDRECNHYRNSMKVREYLSMGKLVVSTNVGDLKKFKDYTIQTNPCEEEFLLGLQTALSKKESPQDAIRRRAFITKNFSWKKIMKEFSETLKGIQQ